VKIAAAVAVKSRSAPSSSLLVAMAMLAIMQSFNPPCVMAAVWQLRCTLGRVEARPIQVNAQLERFIGDENAARAERVHLPRGSAIERGEYRQIRRAPVLSLTPPPVRAPASADSPSGFVRHLHSSVTDSRSAVTSPLALIVVCATTW
jgi:hypothetical protein